MTIKIDENTLGLWYVEFGGNAGNWLASAWRTPDGRVEGTYRERRYVDDKAYDSDDEKSWYTLKPREPTDAREIVQALSAMAVLVEKMQNGERWEILRGTGSLQWFIEEMSKMPFVNKKTATNPANWLCLRCAAENEPRRISCHKCHALRARPAATNG